MKTKVMYFTKDELIEANKVAMARNYNRTINPENIKNLSNSLFPVTFSMIHEHANGVQVKPHMRCLIYTGTSSVTLDCALEFYTKIKERTINEAEA